MPDSPEPAIADFDAFPPAGMDTRVPAWDEAVARLWREHRRWVAAVVYAHKPRDVDVDDLLQDIAMRLVRHMPQLRGTETVRPWLRTVAINVARSAGRQTHARSRLMRRIGTQAAGAMVDESDQASRPSPRFDTAQTRGRRGLELAAGLPAHYREPLLLNLRGLSQKQIALTLDVPVTTIETRLIRARRMLRDELEQEERAASERPSPASREGVAAGQPIPSTA